MLFVCFLCLCDPQLHVDPGLAEPGYAISLHQCRSRSDGAGSSQSVIQYVNFYQQSGSSNLTGCQIEVGVTTYER